MPEVLICAVFNAMAEKHATFRKRFLGWTLPCSPSLSIIFLSCQNLLFTPGSISYSPAILTAARFASPDAGQFAHITGQAKNLPPGWNVSKTVTSSPVAAWDAACCRSEHSAHRNSPTLRYAKEIIEKPYIKHKA